MKFTPLAPQAVQGESEPKEREPEGGEGEEPEPEVGGRG